MTDNFPSKQTQNSSLSSQTTKYFCVNDTMLRRPLGKPFMLKCLLCDQKLSNRQSAK